MVKAQERQGVYVRPSCKSFEPNHTNKVEMLQVEVHPLKLMTRREEPEQMKNGFSTELKELEEKHLLHRNGGPTKNPCRTPTPHKSDIIS